MNEMYKIDGEQAKAIAAIEAEMETFTHTVELQYSMYNDKIKDIVYSVAGLSTEEGNKKMWNINAKYFQKFGFYMAEMEEEHPMFNSFMGDEPPTNNTRH